MAPKIKRMARFISAVAEWPISEAGQGRAYGSISAMLCSLAYRSRGCYEILCGMDRTIMFSNRARTSSTWRRRQRDLVMQSGVHPVSAGLDPHHTRGVGRLRGRVVELATGREIRQRSQIPGSQESDARSPNHSAAHPSDRILSSSDQSIQIDQDLRNGRDNHFRMERAAALERVGRASCNAEIVTTAGLCPMPRGAAPHLNADDRGVKGDGLRFRRGASGKDGGYTEAGASMERRAIRSLMSLGLLAFRPGELHAGRRVQRIASRARILGQRVYRRFWGSPQTERWTGEW